MPKLPDDFDSQLNQIVDQALNVTGWTTRRELEFLGLLAACPTAEGVILEIGSFRGRSATVLANAARMADGCQVVAVDHLLQPQAYQEFYASIQAAGIEDKVEFHRMSSAELARTWSRPIRFLWIDGNHAYEPTKLDFDSYYPFLADGAIVAIHDVLNRFEGSVRVFMEEMLLSDHFGAADMCGSIGWAQYFCDPQQAALHRRDKLKLYRRLSRLGPVFAFDTMPQGLSRLGYRLWRACVPRRQPRPSDWIRKVA